ncbi:uncharacterized protein CANTADRAFT_7422 [Suhomyces tanzawaensis NRRL Y-17324]|uniref:Mtf2-like C-terminal domain-containing protein n=1 Tax=Suhomyces tanzawaensis NRRL Y-17324 TaxID=984487 RepID=A0A1E4SEN1_9ASCO|nr:uncharacterized protein CANTADRAFT_7422 [Suhomyces tanzawaensis NRRL Y-17324]ODV77948.1 hypothetical protein CANTADRAFT_7422 [Suhomyces tanzawaensis NRRL Y-17324]
MRVSRPLLRSYSDITSKESELKDQFNKDLELLFQDVKKDAETKEDATKDATKDTKDEATKDQSQSSEFDLLNDFINQEYEQNTGFKGIIETLDLQDVEAAPVEESNETHFDLDFLGIDKNTKEERKTIEEEKQLFQNIFESYMKPAQEDQNAKDKIMWNIRDSVHSTKHKLDRIVHTKQQTEFSKVSTRLKNEMFSKTRDALRPTIEHIEGLTTLAQVAEYFGQIVDLWMQAVETEENHESLYLNQLLKDATEFSLQHQEYVDLIRQEVHNELSRPKLNVITLPILVNQMIKTCAFKFHDGQLAYSLFNLLKKDVGLYTVACNQDTYNEVLRVLWIYHGKSNLYNIEMAFMEMKNNGFKGDFVTFNILKQIIIDYHNLKMGKLDVNKTTGLPIWSNEDDKRVKGLERKLRRLAESLGR